MQLYWCILWNMPTSVMKSALPARIMGRMGAMRRMRRMRRMRIVAIIRLPDNGTGIFEFNGSRNTIVAFSPQRHWKWYWCCYYNSGCGHFEWFDFHNFSLIMICWMRKMLVIDIHCMSLRLLRSARNNYMKYRPCKCRLGYNDQQRMCRQSLR